MNKRLFVFLFVTFLLSGSGWLSAQGDVLITVTAPEYFGNLIEETVLPQFEAEHPGVVVQFVYESENDAYNLGIPSSGEDELAEYFDQAQAYASLADVLYLPSWILNPVLTRTRYLLDLTPLVTTDESLNVDDFIPAAWESAQWDGGVWVLPSSAQVQVLVYNKDAFDAAGLAYPNVNWSLTDLLDAADILTVFDAEGNVEQLGMSMFNAAMLIQSLSGVSLQDETVIPVQPDFSAPEFARLYQEWLDYSQSHEFSGGSYSISDVPLYIGEPFMLRDDIMGVEGTWEATLLPGGHAGLTIEGFGVSAGTIYPELAYELAKHLTTSLELINYTGGTPARRSLMGVIPESDYYVMPTYSPEGQAIIDRGYENALPSSDLLFGNFLWGASQYVSEEGLDLTTAFQRLEEDILVMLDAADQRAQTTSGTVTIPEQIVLAEGQIVLNFGMNSSSIVSQSNNYWDTVIDEFVASHLLVGDVQIDDQMYGPNGMDEDIDCYYSSYPTLGYEEEQLNEFLALDPLMSADPNFDRNNFIAQALDQVKRHDITYGYPLDIQPEIVVYNANLFAEAGLPEPVDGWDINSFHQALLALRGVQEDPGDLVFSTAQTFGNTYLLMLIAAYGGLPYDFRTDPPTLNLTEPETIEATRQVAQLVHDGLIDYQTLATFGGGGGFGIGNPIPLMAASLAQGNFLLSQRDEIEEFSVYRGTTYPTGNRFVPVSYSVGAAYILPQAQDIQACYDWISTLATHPELFDGIPATLTQFDNPAFAAAKGTDGVAVARNFYTMVNQPNALVLPNAVGVGLVSEIEGIWLETYILNYTFDDIMLNEVDVETAFAEAQSNMETFRTCISGIATREPGELQSPEASRAYTREFVDCAVGIVPDLREQFSYFYQDQ